MAEGNEGGGGKMSRRSLNAMGELRAEGKRTSSMGSEILTDDFPL